MGQWFPAFDSAVGGVADNVEDTGDWVLGGIGSTAGDAVTGTADVVGETVSELGGGVGSAAGSVAGGVFGGAGNWMLKLAALLVGAVVVIKVI